MNAILRANAEPIADVRQAGPALDADDDEQSLYVSDSGEARTNLMIIAGIAVVGLVLAFFVYKAMHSKTSGPREQVVKIAVLPDTPPPPPPPKEEPKPEEKQDSKAPQPEQQKQVRAPPEPAQLKMDGPAGDGPSAFAAGSVNSEYKGGDIGIGPGGGLAQNTYARAASKELETWLRRDRDLKAHDFRVEVEVWLNPDGSTRRAQIVGSTGDSELDSIVTAALSRFPGMDRPLPENMPQPVHMKVSNRSLS